MGKDKGVSFSSFEALGASQGMDQNPESGEKQRHFGKPTTKKQRRGGGGKARSKDSLEESPAVPATQLDSKEEVASPVEATEQPVAELDANTIEVPNSRIQIGTDTVTGEPIYSYLSDLKLKNVRGKAKEIPTLAMPEPEPAVDKAEHVYPEPQPNRKIENIPNDLRYQLDHQIELGLSPAAWLDILQQYESLYSQSELEGRQKLAKIDEKYGKKAEAMRKEEATEIIVKQQAISNNDFGKISELLEKGEFTQTELWTVRRNAVTNKNDALAKRALEVILSGFDKRIAHTKDGPAKNKLQQDRDTVYGLLNPKAYTNDITDQKRQEGRKKSEEREKIYRDESLPVPERLNSLDDELRFVEVNQARENISAGFRERLKTKYADLVKLRNKLGQEFDNLRKPKVQATQKTDLPQTDGETVRPEPGQPEKETAPETNAEVPAHTASPSPDDSAVLNPETAAENVQPENAELINKEQSERLDSYMKLWEDAARQIYKDDNPDMSDDELDSIIRGLKPSQERKNIKRIKGIKE